MPAASSITVSAEPLYQAASSGPVQHSATDKQPMVLRGIVQTTGYLEAKGCGLPSSINKYYIYIYICRNVQHGGIWIRNFPQLSVV